MIKSFFSHFEGKFKVWKKSVEILEGLKLPWNVYQIVHGYRRVKIKSLQLTSDIINGFMFVILELESVNKFPAVFSSSLLSIAKNENHPQRHY